MSGILLYDDGATVPGNNGYDIFSGLRELDYDVVSPGNVQEALSLLDSGGYDIVLVNIRPRYRRFTGISAARSIRERHPSTKVVVYGTENPLFYVLLGLFNVDFWPSGPSGPVDLKERVRKMNGYSEI
ncbi:MAG: response regulator [Candidatus Aenigmarchaeota archaeon]|nr:response regulator [Candidatus Aenigmarchaeota archaeon]